MTEYAKNFSDHLKKIAHLIASRDRLDEQIVKLKKLAAATYELMDERERTAYSEEFAKLSEAEQRLTLAITRVLSQAGRDYRTSIQIRDQLMQSGYDFTRYVSNPLVSIHSTLNRMKDEVEFVHVDERTKAYRFRRQAARSRTLR
jgi:hypothetical protein